MSLATTLPASTTTRDKALDAISRLPPFSPVLNKLMASLADDNFSFADIATVIEKDTVIAGSVLRLVNSSFYGRRGTVNSVKHAVTVLGIGKLRNLSMSMSLARMWNSTGLPPGWSSRSFNQHAVASAILADLIAIELNADYAEGAFTGGLLQNVGLVLIAIAMPEQYASLCDAYQSGAEELPEYEKQILGVTHSQLSGEVLTRWHLPAPIALAVSHHHGPHPSPPQNPLSLMLALSDTIAGQLGILAQPWLRPPEGAPAEVFCRVGLESQAPALLESFQAEYDTIKAFFG